MTTSKSTLQPKATQIAPDGSTSSFDLDVALFGADANESVLAQYIRVYMANTRQGTASTKDRSQIRGTTKKVYKQKGTGNARHGSKKAPIYVGGGVVGGPTPRDYSLSLSKKQRKVALQSALAKQVAQEGIFTLKEEISTVVQKTKQFAQLCETAHIPTRSLLLIADSSVDGFLLRSVRNMPDVTSVAYESVNPYLVTRSHRVFFTAAAYKQFVTRFSA